MDTKKFKPFDLEAAKRGEPLVTRDGRHVSEFHHFETEKTSRPCCAIVEGEVQWYSKDGIYNGINHDPDLFMAPRKVTRWMNFYPLSNAGVGVIHHYKTEEEARRCAASNVTAIAVPIEIEE